MEAATFINNPLFKEVFGAGKLQYIPKYLRKQDLFPSAHKNVSISHAAIFLYCMAVSNTTTTDVLKKIEWFHLLRNEMGTTFLDFFKVLIRSQPKDDPVLQLRIYTNIPFVHVVTKTKIFSFKGLSHENIESGKPNLRNTIVSLESDFISQFIDLFNSEKRIMDYVNEILEQPNDGLYLN